MGVRAPFGFSSNQKATCIYAESMLASRLYYADGMAERYRSAMLDILDTVWNEAELLATIDKVEKLLGEQLHERQSFMPRGMNSVPTNETHVQAGRMVTPSRSRPCRADARAASTPTT
jgi:hypothetical protein